MDLDIELNDKDNDRDNYDNALHAFGEPLDNNKDTSHIDEQYTETSLTDSRYLWDSPATLEFEIHLLKIEKSSKAGIAQLKFSNGDDWVHLTSKRTGEFLATSTLRQRLSGINTMKSILGIDEIPMLDRSFNAARELQ